MGTARVIRVRRATAADAASVAELHADSWRHNYRGAYSDSYLDGEVHDDRLVVWNDRLARSDPDQAVTLLAESQDHLLGFAHTILNADPRWGALVDNLHVRRTHMRTGIGTLLMGMTAQTVIEESPGSDIYLWVLEQNKAAQAFYAARGGALCDGKFVAPPGGDPRNLAGTPRSIRVSWADPEVLLVG